MTTRTKLGPQAAWAMAVGGMVGGGIFSTLGVVVAISGSWAWLSFVAAGLVALVAGYAYVKLAARYGEAGGAFTFLREVDAEGFAGSLSWILIVGYVLTNSVYAFTFGQYLSHVVDAGPWLARAAAVAITAIFIGLNLRGAGEAGGVEIFLVWFKLIVLVGLAGVGLWQWDPPALSRGIDSGGVAAALFGAASVFMAYEGFQLLAYDYDDIRDPDRTLPRVVLTAIVVVIGVYVLVALGVPMIIGANVVVEQEEVALAVAGRQALGMFGLILVTIGAAFSTGSAINSTLFATARLAREVAEDGELPAAAAHTNSANVPDRAVITLGTAAAILAVVGSLATLVEAASLSFLFTFTVVCGLAWSVSAGSRCVTAAGAIAGAAATIALIVRLASSDPWALVALAALGFVAVFIRPVVLRRGRSSAGDQAGDKRPS